MDSFAICAICRYVMPLSAALRNAVARRVLVSANSRSRFLTASDSSLMSLIRSFSLTIEILTISTQGVRSCAVICVTE